MPYTLAYRDRFRRVDESLITSDTTGSIAFASIPDNEPTRLVAEWTGKQFTRLLSALSIGADLMFPEEANEIIWQLVKVIHQPLPLPSEGDDCLNFPPSAPFITYEPSNPFNTPDLIPDGYINQPFHYNSDFAYPEIAGYQSTDVLVPVDAIPVFGDWGDLLGLHFPTIKLHVVGQGQIELDLLAVPLGGQVIIKVGSSPNIIDIIDGIIETGVKIVDLNQDVIAIPPESDLVIAEEIDIDAPEGTDVYLTFVPKIDAATEFFGMGGGIRQIGLCGLETDGEVMGIEDIRLRIGETLANNYMLEKRIAGEWIPVENWDEFMSSFLATTYQNSIDGVGIARALRDTESYEGFSGGEEGWPDSDLKAYIDASSSEEFDPSALEAAIAAAQADADAAAAAADAAAAAAAAAGSVAAGAVTTNTAQAASITAIQAVNTTQNSQIATLQADVAIAQADILAIDSVVDLLNFGGNWAWVHDFTAAGIYTATVGAWVSGFGWNSVGQELIMSYPLVAPKENQITHTCIEVISNNGSYPILEWTWAGVGLAEDWNVVDWQGAGVVNKCWMRFPNYIPIIGNLGLKVRIDTGSFTLRKMTYLGRGNNIPFS